MREENNLPVTSPFARHSGKLTRKSPLGALSQRGMIQGDGVHLMTTLATMLEQKRELIERLHENPGPEEREQIEQLLAKINRALDLVDGAGVNGSD
jgi:hypothetical protein